MDNSKQQIIKGYFDDQPLDYRSDIVINAESKRFPIQEELDTNILNLINETQQELDIQFFRKISSYTMLEGFYGPGYDYYKQENITRENNKSLTVFELTPSIRQELLKLQSKKPMFIDSVVPQNTSTYSEVYLLYRFFFDASGNISNPFNLSYSGQDYVIYDHFQWGNRYNLTVLGASFFDTSFSEDELYTSVKIRDYPELYKLSTFSRTDIMVFIPDITEFSTKIRKVLDPQSFMESYTIRDTRKVTITFDWENIDAFKAQSTIQAINNFRAVIYTNYYSSPFLQTFYVDSFSTSILSQAQAIANNVIYDLLTISVPIILITLFLTNYSFGLVHKTIVHQIGIFKLRGGTSRMIFVFQLVDNFIIIGISVIVGIFSGIPLAYLALQSDNLLRFNYPFVEYYIFNFQTIALFLLLGAIGMTFITSSRKILQFSRMTIADTENPIDLAEPSWQRHYLDFLLLGYGVLFYGILYIFSKTPSLGATLDLLFILGLPSPFALVIGLILLCNRFIPKIIYKIGTILWRKSGGLLAFSFKNVIRHQQVSTRAVLIMAALLAFIVAFYSIPLSNVVYNEQVLYYKYGAEGHAKFGGVGYYNQTDINLIEQNFNQYFDGVSPYIILQSDILKVMLINTSTYVQSIYSGFDLGLQKHSLTTLMDDLDSQTMINSSLPIVIDQTYMSENQYEFGDNFSVVSFSTVQQSQQFVIQDSFRNWPLLKRSSIDRQLGIANIAYYTELLNQSLVQLANSPFWFSEAGIYFNFKPEVNQSMVVDLLEENTSVTFTGLVSSLQDEYLDGIQLRLQFGQINSNVVMTFVISIIVLIMFSYLQLAERRREIFTERALGMKKHQISFLFFAEIMILLISAITLGSSLGILLMQMLSLFITQTNQYPIYTIVLPLDLLTITIFVLLILSIVASVIPAYYASRQDISRGFAGEV